MDRRIIALGLAGLMGTLAFSEPKAQQAECQPSKWGADDEIGAANYVTPEQVLESEPTPGAWTSYRQSRATRCSTAT